MTRKYEEEISLQARAKLARGKKMFLSVHHDSAQPQFLEVKKDRVCSKKAKGYSLFVSRKNAFFEESLKYARFLGEQLYAQGLRPSTHHGEPIKGENRKLLDAKLGIYQYDDLIVLKQAEAPAVLLEGAVIVHPEDEALARSSEYRQKIAKAVAATFAYVLNEQKLIKASEEKPAEQSLMQKEQ